MVVWTFIVILSSSARLRSAAPLSHRQPSAQKRFLNGLRPFSMWPCLRSFDHSISLLSYFLFWCSLLFKHDWEKKFKIGLTLAKSSTYYHYFCYYERERDGDGGRDSLFTADNWVLMGGYFEKKSKTLYYYKGPFFISSLIEKKMVN